MSVSMQQSEAEHREKWEQLYSIIMEKDIKIEEHESKIDDFKLTLKDVSDTKNEQDNYTLITINNAMRTNLKQKERDLEMSENRLAKLLQLLSILTCPDSPQKAAGSDFDNTVIKKTVSCPIPSSPPEVTKNILRVLKCMRDQKVAITDIVKLSEKYQQNQFVRQAAV